MNIEKEKYLFTYYLLNKKSTIFLMACCKEVKFTLKSTSTEEDGLEDFCKKASEAKSTLVVTANGKNKNGDQPQPQEHPLYEEKLSELLLTFHNLPLIPNETALNLLKIQSSK